MIWRQNIMLQLTYIHQQAQERFFQNTLCGSSETTNLQLSGSVQHGALLALGEVHPCDNLTRLMSWRVNTTVHPLTALNQHTPWGEGRPSPDSTPSPTPQQSSIDSVQHCDAKLEYVNSLARSSFSTYLTSITSVTSNNTPCLFPACDRDGWSPAKKSRPTIGLGLSAV